MSQREVLISVVSWEERFLLSLNKILNEQPIGRVILFRSSEYLHLTEDNLSSAKLACQERGISCTCEVFSLMSPIESWKQIYSTISEIQTQSNEFLLDTTTMPRETIWTLLNLLDIEGNKLRSSYSQPLTYEPWLSRDPAKPRIPYKLGGEPSLGKPNSLLVVTGFSPDRAAQLIDFFEPEAIYIAVQSGEQFGNKSRNIENNKEKLKSYPSVNFFEVNAYNRSDCWKELREHVSIIVGNSNLIMSSIGPKPSAIDLYRIHIEFRNTALAYTPSNEYNPVYSKGIGETFTDSIRV